MKTKDRILATSLALFNTDGVAKTPLGLIAAELGISQGNLHYHFRRKQDIVLRLVSRFELEAEPILAGPSDTLVATDDLWLLLHLAFEKIFEYRFIYREIDYLLGEFPSLGPRLRLRTARGLETLRRLCSQLVAAGCMRASEDEVDMLALQMLLIGTCWFTFARVMPEGEDAGPARAAYQVLSLLSPYLADEERIYLDYLRRKYRT